VGLYFLLKECYRSLIPAYYTLEVIYLDLFRVV